MVRFSCPPVSRCRLRRLRMARLQLSRRHYMPGSSRVRWQMYRVIRMHGSAVRQRSLPSLDCNQL